MPKEAVVKYLDLSSKGRPSPHWIKFAAASLIVAAIAGCGGGGTGANTTTTGGAVISTSMTAAEWKALTPKIAPADISVSVTAGKPVVTFKVTDGKGNVVKGLGGQIGLLATALPTNYNLNFTLAKLVPATASAPSKWVSYLVTKPTVAAKLVTGWVGTFPTTDVNGTLVDNGDGTYQYTFLRDITAVQGQVNALVDSGANVKADLDPTNLAYDAAATHRLGIMIVGSQPGTGTNTPDKVQVTAAVPLLNTFNIGYDFVPAGGAVTATRDIVMKSSCAKCHDNRAIGHISTNNATATAAATNGIPAGSFVGRNDPRLCVTCHTDQTKYSFVKVTTTNATNQVYNSAYMRTLDDQAAFTYPRMIHQFHMGDKLAKTGYNLNGRCNNPLNSLYDVTKPTANSSACFNLVGLPQSPTNCSVCHDGNVLKSDGSTNANKTTDGNNWKTKPSIVACGACHDGIDFATGTGKTASDVRLGATLRPFPTGHGGDGTAANSGVITGATDANCAGCHATSNTLFAGIQVDVVHRDVFATVNNPDQPGTVSKIAWDISSVTVDPTSGNPSIKFRIKLDGANVTSLPTFTALSTSSSITLTVGSGTSLRTFTNSPTLYLAYAMPQDGIATPADFNMYNSASLANIQDGTKGFIVGATQGTAVAADVNGYFTATLTGVVAGRTGFVAGTTPPAVIQVPATAGLVTGVIGGHYVQTSATTGLTPTATASIATRMAMKPLDGTTGRRAVVTMAKCEACHAQLGTDPSFHGGDRNDPQACNVCHNGNRTGNGWAVDSSTFIHGLHATDKRTVPYNWMPANALGQGMYPGILKDCNQCHVPNAVNFGSTSPLVPNMLWTVVATGKFVDVGTANVVSYTWTAGAPGVAGYGGVTGAATCVAKTATNSTTVVTLGPVAHGATTALAQDYGVNFINSALTSTTAVTGCSASGVPYSIAAGTTREADGTTLVNSPIASACASCHTTDYAKLHITQNGGSLYVTRASVRDANGKLVNTETCLVCHGSGKVADAAAVHGAQ